MTSYNDMMQELYAAQKAYNLFAPSSWFLRRCLKVRMWYLRRQLTQMDRNLLQVTDPQRGSYSRYWTGPK